MERNDEELENIFQKNINNRLNRPHCCNADYAVFSYVVGVCVWAVILSMIDIRLLFKSCQNAAIHVHTIHINENERK